MIYLLDKIPLSIFRQSYNTDINYNMEKFKYGNHKAFYEKLWKLETEEARMLALKEYLLSLPLEGMLEFNNWNAKGLSVGIDKQIKKGLTEDDKAWFKQQFSQFDDVEEVIKRRKAA
jgi:hypothetical protein